MTIRKIYVTGYRLAQNTHDYATIKYGPNGNQLWAVRYNGPANGDDTASALTIDDEGNIYVTGSSVFWRLKQIMQR